MTYDQPMPPFPVLIALMAIKTDENATIHPHIPGSNPAPSTMDTINNKLFSTVKTAFLRKKAMPNNMSKLPVMLFNPYRDK